MSHPACLAPLLPVDADLASPQSLKLPRHASQVSAAVLVLGLMLLLTACGGLPARWQTQAPRPLATPANIERSVAPPVATTPSPPPAPRAPYAAAVAARFPDPPVSYLTPGLEPGRTSFTTDAELRAQLRGLLREPDAAAGRAGVRLLEVGRSQLGVPVEALLFSRAADASPAGLRAEGRPMVMFIAQQHGDEPAGAEAMLVLVQQLARGPLQPVLRQLDVLILPRANPDGAVRNQRLNANGIDLNRDQLLLRSPEAQMQARLLRDYRPMVVVDAHEYAPVGNWPARFGIVRRHDLLLQYAMTANLPEFVTRASEEWFRKPLLAALSREQLSADWYHTSPADTPDKTIFMGSIRPDNDRNVNGLRNAVGLLIETRGGGLGRLHLQRRVHSQVVAAASILASAAQRADDLQKLRRFVDSEVAAKACQGTVVVEAETTPSEYTLTGLDPTTGADRVLSVNWQSALLLRPLRSRARPCGYWLAADQGEAVSRLRLLGLNVLQVPDRVVLRGDVYRVLTAAWRDAPPKLANDDGGYAPPVPVELQGALIDAEAGSYYVPLTQPLANLAVAALEPDSPSSYLAHGVIDRANALARVTSLPTAKFANLP